MPNLALLGTGLMGSAMAERLLDQGYKLGVFNRTREKADPLAQRGAMVAETPAEAIADADIVVLVLSAADVIRRVLFDSEPRPSLRGKTIIQMGTITPGQSVAVQELVATMHGDYFEAPVLGSPIQAREGKLIIMVGGSAEQLDNHRQLFSSLGSNPIHVGEVGKAAALKLALNQLIAAHMAAFSLSYGFVEQTGVDPDIFLEVLRQSALHAPMFDNKLSRLLSRDFTNPNFPVKHLLKDVNLFLAAAQSTKLDLTALEGIRFIIERAIQRDLGDEDYSAMSEAIRDRTIQVRPAEDDAIIEPK